jgi:D-alanyl-D-alanine carboxypeptidase
MRSLFVACAIAGAMVAVSSSAYAAQGAAIVVDAKSGKILFSDNPDARRYPASLTKMMTLYLLFEALDRGKITLSSRIPVSARAAAQAPSKLGLKPGDTISVRDAILAIVTRSANDVACAIGEFLGGSEDAFAVRMTATARAIGMARTNFQNASGLPDPNQMTTARDMATLGRALQDRFPDYFKFFSTASFVYEGRRIGNHNRLLGRVAGVNGIKTGYTRASGYNLVTSVYRDDRKLVAVVLGGQTGRERDVKMAKLITDYMPRASTGSQKVMVAAAPEPVDVQETVAAIVPAPRSRPEAAEPVIATATVDATAVVATAAVSPDAEAASDEGDGGDDAAASADPKPAEAAMVPRGWKIQIAAAPTQSSATDQLAKAKAKSPKLFASLSPYTQPVVKGSVTLYRARFGGFTSKEKARAACALLTRQDISCLALQE